MALIPYPDPSAAAPATGNLIENAREGVCNLLAAAPRLLGGQPGDGTGGSGLLLFDRICPPPLARPPMPPDHFPGGQCLVKYNVTLKISDTRQDGTVNVTTGLASGSPFDGPISGLRYSQSLPDQFGSIGQEWFLRYGNNQEAGVVTGISRNGARRDVIILSVTRVDGQLDTCGDALPVFPVPINPTPLINININVNVGGTNVLLPLTIIPTIIVPTLNIEPHLNVDVGGIHLDFSLGGINVSLPASPNYPTLTPPGLPPRNPPSVPRYPTPPQPPSDRTPPGGGSGGCPDVDITPIVTLLENLDGKYTTLLDCDRCEPDEPSPLNYDETVVFEGQSSQLALPPQCVFIRLTLTTVPTNAKTQSGVVADNVLYAGWSSFKSFNGNTVRVPIHYSQNIYPRPSLAQFFTFTCYTGFIARVTFIKKKD